MSETEETTGSVSRRPFVWVIAAVVVVVAVVVVWGLIAGWGGTPSSSPTPTPTGITATPDGSPSATPSATVSATPSPTPTATDDARETPTPGVRPTLPPVDIDESTEPVDGVTVSLLAIEPFDATSTVPGDVAGPALRVELRLQNESDAAVDLTGAIVNLYYSADRTPASILVDPREEFPAEVKAAGVTESMYAFTVPADQHDRILVEIDLGIDIPVVLLEGSVSDVG